MGYYAKYLTTHYRHVTGISHRDLELERRVFSQECKELLPKDKNARVLDVACGVGHFLYFLDRSGYRNFLGIDISPEQVAFCRENVTDKVKIADAFEFLRLEPGYWDTVFSSNFIEHLSLDQLIELMSLVYLSLKEEGKVMLRTTNLHAPFRSGIFWDDITHTTPFTEKSMAQLLAMGGFENIHVYPSACRFLPRLALTVYRLAMLSLGVRPPKIVTPAILGVGRKPKCANQISTGVGNIQETRMAP